MILTGEMIKRFRQENDIVIEPFDERFIEPNSYGFHLGETLLEYDGEVDARSSNTVRSTIIPESGLTLYPGRFYLGHTHEKIGGVTVAAELYANRSAATSGIWVQTSAPLGHVGAVINWTLEICVAAKVRVYPRMLIGKICFWKNLGVVIPYQGRYASSDVVVSSKSFMDEL